jgi:hypothetical protein
MSFEQMVKVWEHDFDHPQQAVMLVLANDADEFGKCIRIALARVAWKTGYTPRQIERIILTLKGTSHVPGILRQVAPANMARRLPPEYELDWSKAKQKEPARAVVAEKLATSPPERQGEEASGNDAPTPDTGDAEDPASGGKITAETPAMSTKDLKSKIKSEGTEQRRGKERDSRTDSPALQTFRAVAGQYPPKAIWDQVIEAVGDKTIDQLMPFFREWVKRGYRPMNLGWLFDWATAGAVPQRKNGTTTEPRGFGGVRDYVRDRHGQGTGSAGSGDDAGGSVPAGEHPQGDGGSVRAKPG